jgi:hypothetical protein
MAFKNLLEGIENEILQIKLRISDREYMMGFVF